jgi:hypothetical protein
LCFHQHRNDGTGGEGEFLVAENRKQRSNGAGMRCEGYPSVIVVREDVVKEGEHAEIVSGVVLCSNTIP